MVITVMAELIDIVSSRVKAEVFRLLFSVNQPEIHLRELVRQSGLSLGTVQQEVARLCTAGVISSRRDGNRMYYRANAEHPAHPELSSLVLKTSGLASVLREALKEEDSILSAFVFGSVAGGQAKAGSDVDLMVIGSIGLRKLSALLADAAEKIGREINPHIIAPQEWLERARRNDHFVASVRQSKKIFVKGTDGELAAMGQ